MPTTRLLFLISLAAHVVTGLSYLLLSERPSSDGAGMVWVLFIFPAIWLITLVAAIVNMVANRSKPDPSSAWKPLAFILCTPLPLIAVVWFIYSPDEPKTGDILFTEITFNKGVAYKSEMIVDNDFKPPVHVFRRFKADSILYSTTGDKAFLKDSIWTYEPIEGLADTLRMEYYRNDSLIKVIDNRRK